MIGRGGRVLEQLSVRLWAGPLPTELADRNNGFM